MESNAADKVKGRLTVGGVGGDDKEGSKGTGGGHARAGGEVYPRDVNKPEINRRVPPGVLNDPKLQALGFAHGQTDCPFGFKDGEENTNDKNLLANYGGLESLDCDTASGPDISAIHKRNEAGNFE